MPELKSSTLPRLKTAAAMLEVASLSLAILALAYRATLYWALPGADENGAGIAQVADFGLAMLLFLCCLLCAGVGVVISLRGEQADKRHAYQAFFIGVASFLAYDLLYPHLPRLM